MSETRTTDLATWLTRIWDEEERLAKRAGDWLTAPEIDNYGHLTVPSASVLARIAADRKILELHTPTEAQLGPRLVKACSVCGYAEMGVIATWPCLTLRLLASPYKGREGWQEAWV
jgi:hypothetical protein